MHAKQIKTENRVVSKTIVIIYKGSSKIRKKSSVCTGAQAGEFWQQNKKNFFKKKFQVEHSAAKKLKNKTS